MNPRRTEYKGKIHQMIYFPGTENGEPPILFEYIHHGKIETNPTFKNKLIKECKEKGQNLLINPKCNYKNKPFVSSDSFQTQKLQPNISLPEPSQDISLQDVFHPNYDQNLYEISSFSLDTPKLEDFLNQSIEIFSFQ